MSCPTLETWVAWVLGEAADGADEQLEGHLFDCDACAARVERVELLLRELRTTVPHFLTGERRRRLEAERGKERLSIVTVSPGERKTIELDPERPVGFWVMRADLRGAQRLDCELVTLDEQPLASFTDVPFDAERGEVLLCCQLHFQGLGPTEMLARVTSVDATGSRPIAEYRLNHHFGV